MLCCYRAKTPICYTAPTDTAAIWHNLGETAADEGGGSEHADWLMCVAPWWPVLLANWLAGRESRVPGHCVALLWRPSHKTTEHAREGSWEHVREPCENSGFPNRDALSHFFGFFPHGQRRD